MSLYIVNLEDGMPSVEKARIKLDQSLRTAKARGVSAVKIIHGYGSTGRGGAIKKDVQVFLSTKSRLKAIRGYVKGEDFSPFDQNARKLVDLYPDLAKDSDYSRGNDGITIVLL